MIYSDLNLYQAWLFLLMVESWLSLSMRWTKMKMVTIPTYGFITPPQGLYRNLPHQIGITLQCGWMIRGCFLFLGEKKRTESEKKMVNLWPRFIQKKVFCLHAKTVVFCRTYSINSCVFIEY